MARDVIVKPDLKKFAYAPAKAAKAAEVKGTGPPPVLSARPATHDAALPLLLEPDLLLVFVGFNPGLESARLGHYYAHRSNRFWKFIYQSGLVSRPVVCTDDRRLQKEYRYGFTDLVGRSTKGINELSKTERAHGASILEFRISEYQPRYVCFVGKGIFETVAKAKGWSLRAFSYGVQPQTFGGSNLFVVPSTSGLVSMPAARMLEYWTTLSQLVAREREEHAKSSGLVTESDEHS